MKIGRLEINQAIKFCEYRLMILSLRGDQPSIDERKAFENILMVIKSLTGRK